MLRHRFLAAGLALALAGGGLALAQEGPPRPEGPELGPHVLFARRIEGDAAERLRNLLQLRPQQEPALKAYLEAVKPPDREPMTFEDEMPARTTPERLQAVEARMAEQQAQMKRRIEATRRFYAQLDAGQKRAFDELPPMLLASFDPPPLGSRPPLGPTPPMGAIRYMPMPPAPPKPPEPSKRPAE